MSEKLKIERCGVGYSRRLTRDGKVVAMLEQCGDGMWQIDIAKNGQPLTRRRFRTPARARTYVETEKLA